LIRNSVDPLSQATESKSAPTPIVETLEGIQIGDNDEQQSKRKPFNRPVWSPDL
jgi:hypothetical protein